MDNIGIVGITENNDGKPNDIKTYVRKISTGYAPLEKPWNDKNYPVAAGYFRIMKLTYKTVKTGKGIQVIQKWVLDKEYQKKLELLNSTKTKTDGGKKVRVPELEPRNLPVVCLHRDIDIFLVAKMMMWNASSNLECQSCGNGTEYTKLVINKKGEMHYVNEGQKDKHGNLMTTCNINDCVNRQKVGEKAPPCNPSIKIDVYPNLPGIDPNLLDPMKYDSSSINTVMRLISSFRKIRELMELSYRAKHGNEYEAKARDEPWFFGRDFCLKHIQILSGGNKVWVTDIVPSKDLKDELMGPILMMAAKYKLDAKNRLLEIKKSIETGNLEGCLPNNSEDAIAQAELALIKDDSTKEEDIADISGFESSELEVEVDATVVEEDESSEDENPDKAKSDKESNKESAKKRLIQ